MKYWVTCGLIGGFVAVILLAIYSLITSISQFFAMFIIGFLLGAVIGIALREFYIIPKQLKLIGNTKKRKK